MLKRFIRDEDGNILLLSVFLFLAFTAFAGLVVDGGQLYMNKTHLQKVANAAALSAGQELTTKDPKVVEDLAKEIVDKHGELSSLQNVDIILERKVTVKLNKPVKLFFSSLFGVDSIDVPAKATAKIGVIGRGYGAAPIGINESMELVYGQEYTLKVDETGSSTGFFGILAIEGPGAKTYEQNLMHGFDGELKVGDIVNTQTGNIAGPTKTGIDYLVNTCSDMNDRDCPRILLVPVYKPYNYTTNQLKQVEITGFAHFYISGPMNSQDKTVKGVFMKRVSHGFEMDQAVDKGAYALKLVE
ncbi:pilus assembly protein TadG-related protein [Chungangia koreensis]|uniref:Pilus assembly protein TadG-related protein n=1 Tax=Chungangia koreensis TaxID=752657 RepID=A0ABV8X2I7_9LACT